MTKLSEKKHAEKSILESEYFCYNPPSTVYVNTPKTHFSSGILENDSLTSLKKVSWTKFWSLS